GATSCSSSGSSAGRRPWPGCCTNAAICGDDRMLTILERINQIKGVKGSSIMSPDGIEIVSHFRTPVPSAFISDLIVSAEQVANKIVSKAQTGALMQTMIEATEGKFFVQVVELGYLVVLADSQANTGLIRVEIAQVSPLIR